MAWIIKDSAHERIDRRDEPYLTREMKTELERDLMPRYATRQAALLPICHTVQHAHGWLPYQALEEVATFIGISFGEVIDSVTFYEEFHLHPTGEHHIQLCRSISCELCGCRELSAKVQDKLGILPGETTDDGRFTLMELECIGACELAPAALIDEELKGPMTWERLEARIDELSNE